MIRTIAIGTVLAFSLATSSYARYPFAASARPIAIELTVLLSADLQNRESMPADVAG